ncbi:MAG: WYL domain-containing protein [Clostridiales Family XIII bacterium]|jgi:predicted DNA-binding transcriptional regulator YafY|nr:WYL domain-containing protein [Clostridiales Family XIII bacterium]
MYTAQPKKLNILCILEVLNKYSDADHRLSQKDIIDILKREYDISVDRKAVKRNLMDLIEFGCEIEYSEKSRKSKTGEEELIAYDWYISHTFAESELRLLIDSLLFSKHIPYSQCKALIEKLKGLSSNYFSSHVKHIQNLPEGLPRNPELLYTIEILDEAISKKKQVSFNYTTYGTDKKKHKKAYSDGNIIDYVINPYQMVATNGRYYLICNTDKYDDLGNYRVDRINNIKLLDATAKSIKKVKGTENGFDLPKHMAEHVYMFSGDSIRVTFRAGKTIVDDVIDWFGTDFVIKERKDDKIDVTVKVNEMAMFCWALQYVPFGVEIITPKSLRDKVTNSLSEALEKYR